MPILNVLVIPSSFSVAVIFSTDLLPSGLVLLCELKILFIRPADKENLSLLSTTRCSFKRRKPCTYKWRSLFWIHIGRRHPEQRYGDHIWSL